MIDTIRPTTVKRSAPPRKEASGWKIFIMLASLAATIGGWGILAIDQGQTALTQSPTIQTASLPSTSTQSSGTLSSGTNRQTLRSVTAPSIQPQIITRTRSSR